MSPREFDQLATDDVHLLLAQMERERKQTDDLIAGIPR